MHPKPNSPALAVALLDWLVDVLRQESFVPGEVFECVVALEHVLSSLEGDEAAAIELDAWIDHLVTELARWIGKADPATQLWAVQLLAASITHLVKSRPSQPDSCHPGENCQAALGDAGSTPGQSRRQPITCLTTASRSTR